MLRFLPSELQSLVDTENILIILRVLAALVLSLLVVRLVAFTVGRMLRRRVSDQSAMLLRKTINYTGFVLVLMVVLSQLGLSLPALLGTAGIFAVAIGIASQTSFSNIVSGFFLISEKPFAVGDIISVAAITGVVQSIDLLSIKIRTFDNRFVRVPNETIIKTEVVNITRYPIRRLDFEFVVDYGAELPRLKELLGEIASEFPPLLREPEPLYVIKGFGSYGVQILYGVWFPKDDYLKVKNGFAELLQQRLPAAGFPFAVEPLARG